jgi:trk system potassium uptake protein TrkH
VKFYLGNLVFFTLFMAVTLKRQGFEPTMGKALWDGAFQTMCIATTSGFAVVDNASWSMLPNMVLIFLGSMCACAGSTSGGIKADRMLIMFKSIVTQVRRALYPSAVAQVKVGGRFLRDEDVSPHLIYIALYVLLLCISSGLLLVFGQTDIDALACSVASLGNVGPAIHQYGTYGSFNTMPEAGKLVMTINMFLGRVEIYPVLAVLATIIPKPARS